MRISQYVFALTVAKRLSPKISPIYTYKQNKNQRGIWQNTKSLEPISLVTIVDDANNGITAEENSMFWSPI